MTDRPLRLMARESAPGAFEVLLNGAPTGGMIYRHDHPGDLCVFEPFGYPGWFLHIHEALLAIEDGGGADATRPE